MGLLDLLNQAAQLKSELDSLRPIGREQEARIMQKFRLDWNYHSNHLEGNSLTYGETKALILFGITAQGKPLKDHIEITGHDEAVKWVEDMVKEDRPLTEKFIRELNELILKEPYHRPAQTPDGQPTTKLITPGQYKTQPNHVLTVTGEMFYFALPEETPAKMHDLVEWFRTKKDDSQTNPILLAAEFHYQFIRIHPFDDGNGRTARILMNFILMQYGYPPVVIKTEDKQNYIAALRQADAGLLEPFIEYIASNLMHSLEIMIKGARGENIDEPDDLDKEIVLLEQKLKGVGTKVEAVKSWKTVLDVYDDSVVRLIDDFVLNCQKFDKLYVSANFLLMLENASFKDKGLPKQAVISRIRKGLSQRLNTGNQVDKIKIFYQHTGLKNTALDDLSFTSEITVSFGLLKYAIETQGMEIAKKKLEKMYNQHLLDEEIEAIVKLEIKRHTDFIESEIEKRQSKKQPL